jgi:hypothetical protein
MGTIIPFLGDGIGLRDSVFEPHEIKAMSAALDEVYEASKLHNDISQSRSWRRALLTWYGAESAAQSACVRGYFTRQAWLRRDRGEVGRHCSPRELIGIRQIKAPRVSAGLRRGTLGCLGAEAVSPSRSNNALRNPFVPLLSNFIFRNELSVPLLSIMRDANGDCAHDGSPRSIKL